MDSVLPLIVWFNSATKQACQAKLPSIQDLYSSSVRKRQQTSLLTHRTLDTTGFHCSPLEAATRHCIRAQLHQLLPTGHHPD